MGSSVILPTPGQPTEGPDKGFSQSSIPNIVSFRFTHVDPPSNVYLQRDDLLQLECATQVQPETVLVNVRILTPYAQAPGQPDQSPKDGIPGGPIIGPGYIQTIQRFINLGANRTFASLQIPLLEGYLLSLGITCVTANVRGATWARALLTRGGGTQPSGNMFEVLAGGYVTIAGPIGWPFAPVKEPLTEKGFLQVYTPANPGVGTDLSLLTNAPGRVRPLAFRATLTTGAGAGNRFPSFQVFNPATATLIYQVQDTVAVPASTTVIYSVAPGATNVRGAGAPIVVTMPTPADLHTQFAFQINSSTQGIQAADQWSGITLLTEEWLELQ